MKIVCALTLTSSAILAFSTTAEEFIGTIGYLPSNETFSTGSSRFNTLDTPYRECLVAMNIDFAGGDLASFQGAAGTCCGKCQSNAECTGYTWTDYQGGTCWLKNNVASPKLYNGAYGCVLGPYSTFPAARFADCDMPGSDLGNSRHTESEFPDCEKSCSLIPGCQAVTWTNYEGGTCWFKGGVKDCTSYPGAKTTVVFNYGRIGHR